MPRQVQQLEYTARPPPRPVKRGGKLASRPVDIAGARTGLQNQWHDADTIDPDKPLTDKQKLFIKLVAAGESITSATAWASGEASVCTRCAPAISRHSRVGSSSPFQGQG